MWQMWLSMDIYRNSCLRSMYRGRLRLRMARGTPHTSWFQGMRLRLSRAAMEAFMRVQVDCSLD
jgi:hypothetical protein